MTKTMQAITCTLTAALMLSAAAISAQAGTLTIQNKNCTKTYKGKTVNRVTVHVYDIQAPKRCTNKKVTIKKGLSKTTSLKEAHKRIIDGGTRVCKYKYEAIGTIDGLNDVLGHENASVTCQKDWAGVCQCTKDT